MNFRQQVFHGKVFTLHAKTYGIMSEYITRIGTDDLNKIDGLGLTLVEGEQVDAPAIAELPLTLECRIIYRRDQDTSLMPAGLRDGIYGTAAAEGLCHTAYYGEVTDAYLLR